MTTRRDDYLIAVLKLNDIKRRSFIILLHDNTLKTEQLTGTTALQLVVATDYVFAFRKRAIQRIATLGDASATGDDNLVLVLKPDDLGLGGVVRLLHCMIPSEST